VIDKGIHYTCIVETELSTSSRKQLTKLGDIFTYRWGSDDVVCQICHEACEAAHSPLEKSIIWSVISIRRFTWIR